MTEEYTLAWLKELIMAIYQNNKSDFDKSGIYRIRASSTCRISMYD